MRRLRLAILGYGRTGKDTVGKWLHEHTPLRYSGSTSNVICAEIAKAKGITEEEAWRTRHEDRIFWYNFCNEFRKDDPALLARTLLQSSDLVIGLRDRLELKACRKEKLFDLAIWLERYVTTDPTVTFTAADCDLIVTNNGTLEELYEKLTRITSVLKLDLDEFHTTTTQSNFSTK